MPPHLTPTMSIGHRIAAWRLYRGMTQEVAAGLCGKSLSFWKKIETGERRVEKLSDIIVIAQVLKVPELSDLTGILEWSLSRDQMRPIPVLPGMREALNRLVPNGEPQPLVDLRARTREARRMFHTERLFVSELGRILPPLIMDATVAHRAADGPERRALAGVLSDIYLIASETLRDARDFPLARVAIDRCHMYAREADDPIRFGWATWDSSGVLKDLGLPEEGLAQCLEALGELEPLAERNPTDPVLSILGELYCQTALMHANCGEEASAMAMMDRGEQAYNRIGLGYRNPVSAYVREGSQIMWTPVFAALGKGRRAIASADRFDIMSVPSKPAQSTWLIHAARGYAARREDAGALMMLKRAESINPEQVSLSTHSREIVRDMMHRDRRTISRDVHEFAHRIGLR